jgi:hypothetical protein
MRDLPLVLAQIAAVVVGASGCSWNTSSCGDTSPPNPKTVTVDSGVACEIAEQGRFAPLYSDSGLQTGPVSGQACSSACGPGYFWCWLPNDYVGAYLAASGGHADAGAGADEAGTPCPNAGSTVQVQCSPPTCEGRRTAGADERRLPHRASAGEYFATCCYLEDVSIHAFSRLRAELEAFGAPEDLVAAAAIAQEEERRHEEITRGLARRFGVEPDRAEVEPRNLRALLEVARENAVEGCVRETYGAIVALVRARRARDAEVREALESIARDECRHAAFSWRLAAWFASRLDERERQVVRDAACAAVRELSAAASHAPSDECRDVCGAPSPREQHRIVALLDAAVFRAGLAS